MRQLQVARDRETQEQAAKAGAQYKALSTTAGGLTLRMAYANMANQLNEMRTECHCEVLAFAENDNCESRVNVIIRSWPRSASNSTTGAGSL
jgi:hypothetical protein